MYVYMCIHFFRGPVVTYFSSQHCLWGIYVKRDLTVQSSTHKDQRHGPEHSARDGGAIRRALQDALEGCVEDTGPREP